MAYKTQTLRTSDKEVTAAVLIIYTGGTIGMVKSSTGALAPFDFSAISDRIPELDELDIGITVISFPKLMDSADIAPKQWRSIGNIIHENYHQFDGFVVLHGTDTMAYSASALSFMFTNLNKPIVFTGAQIPIGHLRSDARDNLITALQIASAKENDEPVVREVALYFNSVLLRGNRSQKVRSSTFSAFESQNYPALANSGVYIEYLYPNLLTPTPRTPVSYKAEFDTHVVLVKMYPGLSADAFNHTLTMKGLRGVIIETYGSGNTPSEAWFYEALRQAIGRGIIVLNISQCSGGQVIQGRYESSRRLKDMGVIGGGDITSEAALTKFMFLLGNYNSTEYIKKQLSVPISGEMDT